MERKIGEIFEYNGEWYQTVKSQGKCCSCDFMIDGHCIVDFSSNGSCFYCHRKDKENVIFKKLEKVGEPYNIGKKVFQRYEVFTKPYIFNDEFFTINTPVDDSFISIEIKQNEDMEETNANLSNSENIGKNLKPFSLEAAKSGKPVCTRDGRPARIICFDMNADKPIVALVDYNGQEDVVYCHNNGRTCHTETTYNDLMMLSEKKEGWVNVSKYSVFPSKEEALSHKTHDIIDTVKVSWEE